VCPVCIAEAPVGERPRSYCDLLPCSVCYSRGQSATMLACDGCDQGSHMHCMSMGRKRPPPGAWFCVHCSNPGYPGAGVIGPWWRQWPAGCWLAAPDCFVSAVLPYAGPVLRDLSLFALCAGLPRWPVYVRHATYIAEKKIGPCTSSARQGARAHGA
jgi:hypothetical protein